MAIIAHFVVNAMRKPNADGAPRFRWNNAVGNESLVSLICRPPVSKLYWINRTVVAQFAERISRAGVGAFGKLIMIVHVAPAKNRAANAYVGCYAQAAI